MTIEYFIAIVSVLGAITSILTAISSFRREERKAKLENKVLLEKEHDRKRAMQREVADETIGLYQQLSQQYDELTVKDKELLRTITFVIRNMILLNKTVSDLLSEMEIRWEEHHIESDVIECPFYDQMSEYLFARVRGIEEIVQETVTETDRLLFNGSGPVITKEK